jgi:predicted TIM-barrel fold metal-dependent hydrolase
MTTASSLVERLEAAAHAWENSLTVRRDLMASPAMLREAKVEIERLRVILLEMGTAMQRDVDWQLEENIEVLDCVKAALSKYKEMTK